MLEKLISFEGQKQKFFEKKIFLKIIFSFSN
jgi:hypothetical protein